MITTKENFEQFCNNKFPNKKIHFENTYCFVQAGNYWDNFLHYEYLNEKVHLHIEGRNWGPIRDFLREKVRSDNFEKSYWGRQDCQYTFLKDINSEQELFDAFLQIRDFFEPLLLEFEQQQSNVTEKNMAKTEVTIETQTLAEVFGLNTSIQTNEIEGEENSNPKFTIPDYQRAYEWKDEHVKELLKDTFEMSQDDKTYLMGTIILHKNEDKLDIVDGQQRLITLTILLYILNQELDDKLTLLNSAKFDNIKSKYWIKNTQKIITSELGKKTELQKENYLNKMKEKLSFSVLKLSGENALDLAYTFFDSVNSKGKKLSDFDLLKAHHLMFIPENQEQLARNHNDYWQSKDENNQHEKVLGEIIRRIRQWSRGLERDKNEDRYNYKEFVSRVEPSDLEQDEHHFNRYMQPNVFRSWHRENNEVVLNMKYPQQNMEDLLPMEIPQTIEGGDSFFLYAKRYHEMYFRLFKSNIEDLPTSIQYVAKMAASIDNEKLQKALEASILLYYDKFGENRLIEVATCIELVVSEIRFSNYSVRQLTMLNEIKVKEIIPIILNSTVSSHVIGQLMEKIDSTQLKIGENSLSIRGTTSDSKVAFSYWTRIQDFYNANKSRIKNKKILEMVNNKYLSLKNK